MKHRRTQTENLKHQPLIFVEKFAGIQFILQMQHSAHFYSILQSHQNIKICLPINLHYKSKTTLKTLIQVILTMM